MKHLIKYKLFESFGGTIEFDLGKYSLSTESENEIRDMLIPLTDKDINVDITYIQDEKDEVIYIIEIFTTHPKNKINILDIDDDINFLVNYMVNNLGFVFFGYNGRLQGSYIPIPNIKGILNNRDLSLARIPNLTKLYVKFKNNPQLDIDDV